MYCIYKEVLGFAGYILGLKGLVSGSGPISIMAEILGPAWYSRPGYLLIPVHNRSPPSRQVAASKSATLSIHVGLLSIPQSGEFQVIQLYRSLFIFSVHMPGWMLNVELLVHRLDELPSICE